MKAFHIASFSFLLILSSCASIFRGDNYTAKFQVDDHPNAKIYVNNELVGTGKGGLILKRDRMVSVTMKQEGCPDQTKNFDKRLSAEFIFFNLGLVGVLVDLGSGAMYKPEKAPEIYRQNAREYHYFLKYSECPEQSN